MSAGRQVNGSDICAVGGEKKEEGEPPSPTLEWMRKYAPSAGSVIL